MPCSPSKIAQSCQRKCYCTFGNLHWQEQDIFVSAFWQTGTKFFIISTFVMPIAESRMKETSPKEDTIMV